MKKMSLEQRGALLVLFPLVCQIVFVLLLTAQLLSIHANISRQSQSCDLITKTISLNAYAVNLGRMNRMHWSANPLQSGSQEQLPLTGVTSDNKRFALLGDKIHQIGERFEPDQVQRHQIAVFTRTGEEVLRRLKELRYNQEKGWKHWKHVHDRYEIALVNSCQQMLNAADNVVEYEEAKRLGSEEATNSQFENLNTFLTLAIAVTIVAAFVMAAFYIRDILIPLKHLRANCLRISRQEALLPVLQDGSEFSQLDEILHAIRCATLEEQEREKSMVENTNDLICSLSQEGKFLRANKSAREFFGIAPEAIVGESLFDFVADEDRALAEKGFHDALAEGESSSLEFRIKQGQTPPLRAGSPCEDVRLMHTRWSCLYSSESKELFAVVHNIEQEKIVERLRQDFVDMVSHDLRSPLSSMHVSLDLVGQKAYGEISKEAEQEVFGAQRNLIRLLDFVNDLLDFQKLKHGTLQLECDNAHVDSLVQSALDLVKPALQAKEIKIETSGEDILLFADPKKMVQLLTNLLANAIHYTPKNGKISVAWARSLDHTEISVSDTGPGIAEEFRKRIFEAFEQTPEAASKGEGTGLGLAICKLICDAHNASIFVQSEVGKGSKFIVRIPSPKG